MIRAVPSRGLRAAVAALCLCASSASAQGTSTAIDFDALPRKARVDSSTTKQRDPVVVLREQLTAQRDSIARLTRALSEAKGRVDTVVVTTVPRVDTVRVVIAPVAATVPADGTSTPAEAPAAKPVPATASAATTFPPTAVTGMMQIQSLGGDNLRSTFRIRRAELKLVSDLGRGAIATVMIDVSKALVLSTAGPTPTVLQGTRVIQDAFLSMPFHRIVFEAGQQRLPLGLEGSHGSSALETIERSLMTTDKSRGASYGDVRDLGLMAKGRFAAFEYKAGVFNGSGEAMNEADRNVGKSVAGQLIWRPAFVKGLRIGTSGVTSGAASGDKPTRDRAGMDVQLTRGRLLLQAEGMAGRDGAVVRHGMYALAAWSLLPNLKVTGRFDAWDPDVKVETSAATVTGRDYTAGLTWAPKGTRLRLQSALIRKTYSSNITPAATLVLTQVQAAW
jgi:hypothetical protein